MGPVEGLMFGLEIAMQPEHLFAAFLGALAGTIIGLLPGLGPVAGAAVLLPFTFTLSPTAGLIMIAGIYYGVMYGGSTTAVLLNIPGEAPSIVAAIEGYELSKQGRAGPALFIITAGSFLAGTLSVVLVTFFTPVVAKIGIQFGSAEFFALTLGGLLVLARIQGGSFSAGLVPMIVGLILGTIGEEAVTGTFRFTYGVTELGRGLDLVAVAIGLFGITELLNLARTARTQAPLERLRVRDLIPTKDDLKRSLLPWARGGPIGFFFGLLPGPSATLATFASYRVEKGLAKDKSRFGKGAIEGLAGPEAANNAAATSSIIPVLALGIPFSATLALMLSALIVQGVQPGPLLIEQNPEIFWGVIASMYIGNVILVVLNVPLIGVWVSFLRTPYHLLLPVVTVIALAGAFSARASFIDLYAILLLGAVGYLFGKIGYQLAPLLIGFILGPMIEQAFRESLFVGRGDPTYLVTQPLAGSIWVVVLIGVVIGSVLTFKRRSMTPSPVDDQSTATSDD